MKARRVRLLLGALVAAALVLPGLAAWLALRAWKGREAFPRTLEVDLGPVFLDPAKPDTWGARHLFEFTNPASDATAHLSVVYNSCGCSACLIERPEVPPGERSQILLSMSVPYYRQDRREWAIIATGLPEYDQVVVSLAASFYPRIAIEAEELPEAGLAPGTTHTLHVTTTAYQPAGEKPSVPRLTCTDERAEVRAAGPAEVRRKGTVRRVVQRWEVVLHGASPEDASAADVLAASRLVAAYGRWRAVHELACKRRTAITASPAQLVLQPDSGGSAAAAVSLVSQQAFAILGIEASEGLRVEYAAGGRQARHELTVQAAWDTAAGLARKGNIVVKTDHPRQPRVVLPVFVLYLGT